MPSEPRPPSPAAGGPAPPTATLEDVLDQYMQALAAGANPDQDAYLRSYPELADALRGLFRTLDFVEATSRALRAEGLAGGQRLGDFRIVRELARGGMGVVYEAVQTSLNRRVALKVLPSSALLSQVAPERFAREAQAAARLHHTNIVPVYAVGEDQGIRYYAMQFIEGRSLAEHLRDLRRAGTAPGRDWYAQVAHWGRQAAEALDYAHRNGTIHRDVKPANLLLDAQNNVWLTDFGLARAAAHATLTFSGDVVGTARYMSPEQARGGRTAVDGRTDIYSLGATLYELLALRPAFDGESRDEVLNRVAFADPTPLHQVNAAIPRDLETIVLKCMQQAPDERYARAGDLAEDLRRFLAGEPIRARRTPAVVRAARQFRRHRTVVLATTVAILLAFAVLALAVHTRRLEGQQCVAEAYQAFLFDEDYEKAVALLDRAAALGVDSRELHLYRGLVPLFCTQPERAMPHLMRALQRAPDDVEANLALAWAYSLLPDYHSRQRTLDRVPEARIQSDLAWLLHGHVLSATQRSQALESFDRAILLRPDFSPAISARAKFRALRLLTENARDELAAMLNDCDALVTFRPMLALSYVSRAHGWLSAASYAATQPDLRANRATWLANGRRDLDEALRLRRPGDSRPLNELGLLLRSTGDFAGAAQAFGEARALEQAAVGQANPPLVHKHGLALYALGETAAALRAIEADALAHPDYYPLALQRTLLLAELARLDEARQLCREQLRRHHDHANALFLAIGVAELLGDHAAAADAIRALGQRDPAELTSEDGQRTTGREVADYLTGRLDAAGLLAAAADAPGPRCEYAFVIALREFGAGNRAAARAALTISNDTQIIRFIEQNLAQLMLARLAADPAWPAWLPPGGAE